MIKDYIYYLGWISFVLNIIGLFLGKLESKSEHRLINFFIFGLPIAGRFFGWW